MKTRKTIPLNRAIPAVCIAASMLAGGVAQADKIEKIYAGSSCSQVIRNPQNLYMNNADHSLEPNAVAPDTAYKKRLRVFCPITRQVMNSSLGAKAYVYIGQRPENYKVSMTIYSHKPHNGVLVSSATRAYEKFTGPVGDILLAKSVTPSSTWGHYVLLVEMDGDDTEPDPRLHSYRFKEWF